MQQRGGLLGPPGGLGGGGLGGAGGPGAGGEDTRNWIVFIVLSLAILLGTQFFILEPAQRRDAAAAKAARERAAVEQQIAPPVVERAPLDEVLSAADIQRVMFDTPSLDGGIRLEGARFDNLNLKNYRRALPRDSGEVALLQPKEAAHHFDAVFGWVLDGSNTNIVDESSPWTTAQGATLTPSTPLVLTYRHQNGLVFTREIRVDDNYMFTLTDTVENTGQGAFVLRPYGVVRRSGKPEDFVANQIVHQGFVGAFGPNNTHIEMRYQKADEHARRKLEGRTGQQARMLERQGTGGWLGIGDHYWLAALIPPQDEAIAGFFDSRCDRADPARPTRCQAAHTNYRASYTGALRALNPGGKEVYTQRLFAGAKRVEILQAYQNNAETPIPSFDKAVDWGMFWFLTRPFFALLEFFYGFVKNFGVAILFTTVVIKLILFPLVYQSYKAMAGMRKIGPKMKEIQERFAADKPRQQQEIMKLYQTEKINPIAGCLPILVQIPIFYALYKVLTVTIEMRHAPFFGWVQDLSARDPTSIFNLFGLLPFDPGAIPLIGGFLLLGVWPILYGLSMWGVQALSPPPTDPIQAAVFKWLPVLFTFLFASFAAGMVIYWTWSNVLSMIQQYVIMRRQGVETELDKFLAKRLGKGAAAPAE